MAEKNVGTTDRVLRGALGAVMVGYGLMRRRWGMTLLGLYPLLTGITGSCPVYRAMGFTSVAPPLEEEEVMEILEEPVEVSAP